MYLNPVIATLLNTATGRFHPILFIEHPLPGGVGPTRHKSKGHHTLGFNNRSEADEYESTDLALQVAGARVDPDVLIEWDGQDIPDMIHFFEAPSDRHALVPKGM